MGHIFITQFFHKFDLRTTMLYICENHFQRLSKRSLFTGLKASNHFGRPDMSAFLRFVQKKHSYVSKVGEFSCGPRAVTRANSRACEQVSNGIISISTSVNNSIRARLPKSGKLEK